VASERKEVSVPLEDEQKKRLDDQAKDLDDKAEHRPGTEKEAFKAAAKLLRDRGLRKGLDDFHDDGKDPEAFSRPVAYFRKKGADVPEGIDVRYQARGS
jgi:hypothetical protein